MAKVLVPIADGNEDIELVTIVDVLRRAGIEVVVASIYDDRKQIVAARKTNIVADALIKELMDTEFDMIVLPGGMPGAEHLRDSKDLITLLKNQNAQGKYYGAICASPVVALNAHGLLTGKKATCYPGFENELSDKSKITENVVIDNNVITSRGPATAMDFALEIIGILVNKDEKEKVGKALLRYS